MEGGARASPLDDLLGAAITCRIGVRPRRGQKAFTLQTLTPANADEEEKDNVARLGGLSLHAGIAANKTGCRCSLFDYSGALLRPGEVTDPSQTGLSVSSSTDRTLGSKTSTDCSVLLRFHDCPAQGMAPCTVDPSRVPSELGRQVDFARLDVLALSSSIHLSHDVPEEARMAMELESGALDACAGVVRYHPVFGDF